MADINITGDELMELYLTVSLALEAAPVPSPLFRYACRSKAILAVKFGQHIVASVNVTPPASVEETAP